MASTTISNYFGGCQKIGMIHAERVLSAEVIMCPFVVMHDLPFQAADNLTDLLSSMFPDSKIASDYACKHTKTKSIICDLHLKKAVVKSLAMSP